MEDLVQQWESINTTINYSLNCDEAVDDLDRTIVIQVFRVIQESMTNIVRHANASQVVINIEISTEPATLHLLVSDDGQGCDLECVASGFGLLGMEERIKLLGGSFKLQSQANKGLQINATIPL